jgi:GMP synthase-like glutamine amidotransferase
MRTLVADFYRRDSEQKVPKYLAMIEQHSEALVVPGLSLEPSYDLSGYQALVITGSQWMLADEDAPIPTKEFVRELRLPLLGICFGHQLLARAFGAEVLSATMIDKNETVRLLEKSPLFAGFEPEFEMCENHREYVDFNGAERSGLHVIAGSNSCPVEAMHHPLRPLYGVQFHPERSGVNGERLFENFYRNIVQPFWRTPSGRGW